MNNEKFKLTDEQRKVCHDLTMEFIRQNNVLNKEELDKKNKEEDKHKTTLCDRIRNSYFSIYEEIAIGVYDNWDRIQELDH